MQINRYITLPKSSLFTNKLFLLLRLIFFIGIGIYIWMEFSSKQDVLFDIGLVKTNWQLFDFVLLLIVFLFLPINWSLEAIKWQLIAKDVGIKFLPALKAVLLGLTLDHALPAGTGSISGRIVSIPRKDRLKVIPGILAGQIIQSIITFTFGIYGVWTIWYKTSNLFVWQPYHIAISIIVISIIVLSLVFWKDRIVSFISPLKEYTLKQWIYIFVISLTRYVVFLLQFFLLALLFSPELEAGLMLACATWVFAARTFMPKLSNIEGLGIRALAVVFFMSLFNLPSTGLLMVVIILWFVNLAIPSLVGLSFLRNIKLASLLE